MRVLIRYDENSENDLARAGVTLGKLAIVFGAVSIGYVPGLFVLDTRRNMNMDITKFIPHGRDNMISGSELAQLTRLDSRTVKQLIADARTKGTVICSSLEGNRGGYFIPVTPEEAVEYVRTERSRISSAIAALRPAEEYIKDTEVQE